MKLRTIDTSIVFFALVAPVMPGIYAKQLVVAALGIVVLRLLLASNLKDWLLHKIIILLLLFPSLAVAVFNSPENLVRFAPALLLTFGFPFSGLRICIRPIIIALLFIIAYLVSTQFLIALGNAPAIAYRDAWYPIENNVWSYGDTETLFVAFGQFRAAGIFYNPNVLGLVLTLYFYLYASLSSAGLSNSKNTFRDDKTRIFIIISLIVIFSVYFTGSRTALIALLSFLYFTILGSKVSLNRFLTKKAILAGLTGAAFILYFLWERVWQGIADEQGSANIKFQILMDHLQSADLTTLLIGGVFSLQFDAEYGYWVGAVGFLGIIALGIMLRLYYKQIPTLPPIIIGLLLMAIGNSVFYGLLTGTIAAMVFLILSSLYTSSAFPGGREAVRTLLDAACHKQMRAVGCGKS